MPERVGDLGGAGAEHGVPSSDAGEHRQRDDLDAGRRRAGAAR